ncbi:MAG TPA: hypothetical protein EYP54_08640, partial [Anaerolineales bacterium]|nr:hypothetical protein [Anaerolineales bacterium]
MITLLARLTYPSDLLDVPVVSQLIRRFNITLNIHRAEIGLESGWLEAHLGGDCWLRNRVPPRDPAHFRRRDRCAASSLSVTFF